MQTICITGADWWNQQLLSTTIRHCGYRPVVLGALHDQQTALFDCLACILVVTTKTIPSGILDMLQEGHPRLVLLVCDHDPIHQVHYYRRGITLVHPLPVQISLLQAQLEGIHHVTAHARRITWGACTLDLDRDQLRFAQYSISLTLSEKYLLQAVFTSPMNLTRSQLSLMLSRGKERTDHRIDTVLYRLRQKLSAHNLPLFLHFRHNRLEAWSGKTQPHF